MTENWEGVGAAAEAWAEQAERAGRLDLDAIVGMLGERGTAGLLAALAGVCIVAGIIPSFSTLIGIPMLALALWLAAGGEKMAMPDWMARKALDGPKAGIAFRKAGAFMRRIERIARRRQEWLLVLFNRRVVGLFSVVMTLVVLLPLPGMNFCPSVAMAMMLVGWLEKDGWLALGGFLVGCLAIAIVPSVAVMALS